MPKDILDQLRSEGKGKIDNVVEHSLTLSLETDKDGWLKARKHLRKLFIVCAYTCIVFLIVMLMWIICVYVSHLVTDPLRVESFMTSLWNFILTVCGTVFLTWAFSLKKP